MPRLHAARFLDSPSRQHGVTLVELVISIVIIGIAAAAILGAYANVIRASADPMIRAQAIAIAETYMDEIMGRPFAGDASPGDPRQQLDNIQAYNGLTDNPPENAFGNELSELSDYTVSVTVTQAPNDLGLGADERRITVQVSDDAGTVNISLNAWRTR